MRARSAYAAAGLSTALRETQSAPRIPPQDYASMLTAKNRMDQGVALLLDELEVRRGSCLPVYAVKKCFYSAAPAVALGERRCQRHPNRLHGRQRRAMGFREDDFL